MQSDSPLNIAFVPVLHAMVEGRLKLIVTTKIGYVEDPVYISVIHDPLLDQDNLTRPASDFEERSWRRLNKDSPAPRRIARSDRAEEILWIPIRSKIVGDRLVVIVVVENGKPAFDGRLIERVSSRLIGRSNDVLHAVLEAALRLPAWDILANDAGLSNRATVALFVSEELANRLGQSVFKRLSEDPSLILLGERRIEAT